jgi:hypothetical protein
VRDRLAIGALVLLLLADLGGLTRAAGVIALAAALLNAWRLHGWQGSRTLREPILWVLHLGYLWLAIGLAWKGMVELSGFLPPADALHGLAIGAVGTMTLAIMSRATLGHTGRPLHAPPLVVASYLLVGPAAIARLAAPPSARSRHLVARHCRDSLVTRVRRLRHLPRARAGPAAHRRPSRLKAAAPACGHRKGANLPEPDRRAPAVLSCRPGPCARGDSALDRGVRRMERMASARLKLARP